MMFSLRSIGFAGTLILMVAMTPMAQAQWPRYGLNGIFPAGGQHGASVEVQVSGLELDTAEGLWFDAPGMKADLIGKGRFRVEISPEVPPGHHDVRIVGPLGISNPRSFLVASQPETTEVEPNNTRAQAGELRAGETLNGQVNGATDVDWYKLEAAADQRFVLQLQATEIESRLSPVVRVYDPNGREIAVGPDPDGDGADRDPLVDFQTSVAGLYHIEVIDRVYSGSPDHVYRLFLGRGAHIDIVYPMAVVPGQESTHTVLGRMLGAETTGEESASAPRELESRDVQISPSEIPPPDPRSPGSRLLTAVQTGHRGFEYRLETPDGLSNPFFVAEALGTVFTEKENGEGLPDVEVVTLPCDVSARFEKPEDRDIFRFEAKKGQIWKVEVLGERIGSAVDTSFEIQKVDAEGKVERTLASADDTPDRGLAPFFSTACVDPTLRWEVPEDGTYQIVLQDLYGSHRGSPRLYYRLAIHAEQPDFQLFVVGFDGGRPEGMTLRAGGRAVCRVLVDRLDGFAQPIRLDAMDLPRGVSCASVILGPSQATVPVVLEASAEAEPGNFDVQFVGRGLSPDRKEWLVSGSGSPRTADEPEVTALPGTMIWPPAQNNQPAPARATHGFVLAVRPQAPFRLTASPAEVIAKPEEEITLAVSVERLPGFDEVIEVSTDALPPKMGEAKGKIEKDQNSIALKLTIPKDLAPGPYSIVLTGTGNYPFQKDPGNEKKDNIKAVEPSNVVLIHVSKP